MSSRDTPKTVLLSGDPTGHELVMKAGEAIIPGMLVETHTDGTLKKHAVDDGPAARRFAREADYVGYGIDRVYLDGERVPIWACEGTEWIYAWLANNENVAIGAYLSSAGNGALEAVGTAGYVVARALEAVNNTSGGNARIRVEVV